MARPSLKRVLDVWMNGRLVGEYTAGSAGEVSFRYAQSWLERGFAVSRQLPMTDAAQRGENVNAVFENLLPDSPRLRQLIAEKTEARSARPHDLLAAIGRDCVGAMQFIAQGDDPGDPFTLQSEAQSEAQIAGTLRNLALAPLGMRPGEPFRISLAGAQEKTAFLWRDGAWHRPHGLTPTTHIFKRPMGVVSQQIDMTDSVENEYLCLKLVQALGLPVNDARIGQFEDEKALILTRFDRTIRARDGVLLRLPQEDFLQAMGLMSGQKYQEHGGPGFADCVRLAQGSVARFDDMKLLLQAQIVFWMLNATDGHAKNFSIALRPDGYAMTPLYDILSAAPFEAGGRLGHKDVRVAMSVGQRRYYRMDQIHPRHFGQSARRAGIPARTRHDACAELLAKGSGVFDAVADTLPAGFPDRVLTPVIACAQQRFAVLAQAFDKGVFDERGRAS